MESILLRLVQTELNYNKFEAVSHGLNENGQFAVCRKVNFLRGLPPEANSHCWVTAGTSGDFALLCFISFVT